MEAMALAVERAAVVLICMSQMYKDSASCRTGTVMLAIVSEIRQVCTKSMFFWRTNNSAKKHFVSEAEYTYSQRKDIIPLLLQQGYVPDGWLGALVGTRIYVDLTDEETLPNQVGFGHKKVLHGRVNCEQSICFD